MFFLNWLHFSFAIFRSIHVACFYFHHYHYHLTSSKMNMCHLTVYFRIVTTYYIHYFHRAFFLTRCYMSRTHDILPNHHSYYSVMVTCVRQKKGYFWLVLGVNQRKVLIIWIFKDKVKLYKNFRENFYFDLSSPLKIQKNDMLHINLSLYLYKIVHTNKKQMETV